MKATPKHREISRQLSVEIATGKFGPGGRLPSETQLVEKFHVSRPTIARAFRDLQFEGLIERRAGSGTYVRAQRSAPSGARQLGLLVPDLAAIEIFGLICGELVSIARAHDFTLLWGDSTHPGHAQDTDDTHVVELCEQFIAQRVSGVFFAPFECTSKEINRRIVDKITNAGIPVVLLDRDIVPFPHRTSFDLVSIDNFASGCLLAEHLFKLGCRRFAFVARPNSAAPVDARIAGVRDALLRHRIELPDGWIRLGDPEDLRFVRSLTAGRRWDAVVCANDLTAAQLMRGLEKDSIRVPHDLRVVGFDDAKFCVLLKVPLTTIHQPCRDIAVTAYRAMQERIAEPTLPGRSLLLTPRIVVRESCGAYLPHQDY